MATKTTYDTVRRAMIVEKAKDDTIVHLTPRIIVELKRSGKLWTTTIKKNNANRG